MHCYNRRQCTS